MDANSSYFRFFAECKLVKGAKRSAIYDLPRGTYKLIPNALYDILTEFQHHTVADVKHKFDKKDHKTLDEYFAMLVEEEYIFFCDKEELELFPPVDEVWDHPGTISNAIIELPMTIHKLFTLVEKVEKLGCRHLQFRSLEVLDTTYLEEILKHFALSDLDHIEIITHTPPKLTIEKAEELQLKHPRLRLLIYHSSLKTKLHKIKNARKQNLIFTTEKKQSHHDFHQNGKNYFNANMELFCESKRFNNYYNRKVCISRLGEIKNCLSLDNSFGNIGSSDLEKVVKTKKFQLLWHVNKDQVDVCKDCEFRYMCVDSTPLLKEKNTWQRQWPCFYDPYTAKFTSDGKIV